MNDNLYVRCIDLMLYQAKVSQTNEQFTIGENGEMVQKSKAQLQKEFASENEIARFSENDL